MPHSTSNDFIFSSLWSKSDSQLSKYYVDCKISWCRCQQLTALSINTALVIKLLVMKQLLHPALKFAVSAPWHNLQLCSSTQQILAMSLTAAARHQWWPSTLARTGFSVKSCCCCCCCWWWWWWWWWWCSVNTYSTFHTHTHTHFPASVRVCLCFATLRLFGQRVTARAV